MLLRSILIAATLVPTTAWSPGVGLHRSACRTRPPTMDMFTDLKRGFTKITAGDYDEAAVKAQIERDIARKPCIMYSTTTCPFCKSAKKVLDDMNAIYTNIECDVVEDGAAIRTELEMIIGRSSVPAVFVGGKFVGGCDDGGLGGVIPLKEKGELESMLIASGSMTATQRI